MPPSPCKPRWWPRLCVCVRLYTARCYVCMELHYLSLLYYGNIKSTMFNYGQSSIFSCYQQNGPGPRNYSPSSTSTKYEEGARYKSYFTAQENRRILALSLLFGCHDEQRVKVLVTFDCSLLACLWAAVWWYDVPEHYHRWLQWYQNPLYPERRPGLQEFKKTVGQNHLKISIILIKSRFFYYYSLLAELN